MLECVGLTSLTTCSALSEEACLEMPRSKASQWRGFESEVKTKRAAAVHPLLIGSFSWATITSIGYRRVLYVEYEIGGCGDTRNDIIESAEHRPA